MALIKDPLDAAEAVSNANEAARLRDDLRQTLSTQPGLSPKWERDAKQAMEWAENEYPEIKARGFGQGRIEGLSAGQRRYKQSGKATTRTGKNRPAPTSTRDASRGSSGAASRRVSRPQGTGRRRPAARRKLVSGRIDRAVEQTGLPSLGRSATAVSLQVIGVVVGLSFLYLLLRDAQRRPGRSAVETISKGVSAGVQLLVNPVDPFSGPTRPTPAGGRGGDPDTRGANSIQGVGQIALPGGAGAEAIRGVDGRSTVRRRRRPAHAPKTSTRQPAAGARR